MQARSQNKADNLEVKREIRFDTPFETSEASVEKPSQYELFMQKMSNELSNQPPSIEKETLPQQPPQSPPPQSSQQSQPSQSTGGVYASNSFLRKAEALANKVMGKIEKATSSSSSSSGQVGNLKRVSSDADVSAVGNLKRVSSDADVSRPGSQQQQPQPRSASSSNTESSSLSGILKKTPSTSSSSSSSSTSSGSLTSSSESSSGNTNSATTKSSSSMRPPLYVPSNESASALHVNKRFNRTSDHAVLGGQQVVSLDIATGETVYYVIPNQKSAEDAQKALEEQQLKQYYSQQAEEVEADIGRYSQGIAKASSSNDVTAASATAMHLTSIGKTPEKQNPNNNKKGVKFDNI